MLTLSECGVNPLGLYEVKEGDTAQSVCARCGVPAAALIAANGLRAFPPPGSMLLIPPRTGTEYVVQAGDTLASICARFRMSQEEFVRRNGCDFVYPTQRVWVGGGTGQKAPPLW